MNAIQYNLWGEVRSMLILNDLLDEYAEHGLAQFKVPEVLKVPPISGRGKCQ